MLSALLNPIRPLLPLLLTLAIATSILAAAHWLLTRPSRLRATELPLARPLAMLVLSALAIVATVLVLPVADGTRNQLLSLLGLVLTAMIALSSTSFVSNAMAGLMLRILGNFRPGDFVRAGDQFGRVTERGLFHTELQTEDRDLTTLPNLFLITNPVTVVRYSGTIVSATVTLGYGVDHARAERLLCRAAETVGLTEAFVHIVNLGDVSVEYRAAGLLTEVKHLLSARSQLRSSILDTLHAAGIEIMSPAIMDQRRVDAGVRYIPPSHARAAEPIPNGTESAETVAFDKAEQASEAEALRIELEQLDHHIAATEKGPAREALMARRDELSQRLLAAEKDRHD